MQWLVSFDVADDKRRYRLTRVLLDYGQRLQESVFWLECEDDLAERIRLRLRQAIDEADDNLFIVPACEACVKKMEGMGKARIPEIPEFYIF